VDKSYSYAIEMPKVFRDFYKFITKCAKKKKEPKLKLRDYDLYDDV
jgi:hypothetical protein